MPNQNKRRSSRREVNSRRSHSESSEPNHTLLILNLVALATIAVAFGIYLFFRQGVTTIPQIQTQSSFGMGNTPANISNYAYVVSDENNVYLANYNKIGTIIKRSNNGNEESFVNLNTDSVNISGLNIYGDSLYFLVSNSLGQQSIYVKSLVGSDNPRPLANINRSDKTYLVPFIFSNTIFVFASKTGTFDNTESNELIEYDLEGNQINDITLDAARLTTDGEFFYSLNSGGITKLNPVDLSSEVIYNFGENEVPSGTEFFYFEDRLFIPLINQSTNTTYIATFSTADGTFQTILEHRSFADDIKDISFNANNEYLFLLYNYPISNNYAFSQFQLSTGEEKAVFEASDNYPNLGVDNNTPVNATFTYTTENGVYYLRTFEATKDGYDVGVYSYIAYNTNTNQPIGNFFNKNF